MYIFVICAFFLIDNCDKFLKQSSIESTRNYMCVARSSLISLSIVRDSIVA